MNKTFFSLLLILILGFALHADPLRRANILYNNCGDPSDPLLTLLNSYSIPHDGTWKTIVPETQKAWLKDKNNENWMLDATKDPAPEKTFSLFSLVEMTQGFESSCSCYDYALVLGSILQVVRDRLHFLKKEWEKGMRFKSLVFLGSDRQLYPIIEGEKGLLNSPYPIREGWSFQGYYPKNETEMLRFAFDQMDLPEEWRTAIPFLFVHTPGNPHRKRPRTIDTLEFWLKSFCPTASSLLIVSSQPFIGRADSIARYVFAENFIVETVGPGFTLERYIEQPQGLGILKDELARWIYQERCY
jgi:hypothetical protein